jgi:WD40 repeat protein
MNQPYRYRIGGSLSGSAPCYVVRQADEDLYQALTAGEFCYVFNARQMGKSSLRLRAMEKLQAEGVTCTTIDMTAIGSQKITPEQWYGGIVLTLVGELKLADPLEFLKTWWQPRSQIAPIQRLADFLETVLLQKIEGSIVIFIDEIDSVLSLEFPTDDFFALIRRCYEQRNVHPIYQRLTFSLIGVATPSGLIQDANRTPFNIGRAIALRGFQANEVDPLIAGLIKQTTQAPEIIHQILAWTRGQPFLTQKICQMAIDHTITEAAEVSPLIEQHLIQNWESHDEPPHLKTIRDRILRQNEYLTRRLLTLYQDLLQSPNQSLPRDNSEAQQLLCLSGLAIEQNGSIVPHNRIYARVFDGRWVKTELSRRSPYATELEQWLLSKRQDSSWLLRGQVLQNALQWSQTNSISKNESQFLNRSLLAEKELTDRENDLLAAEKEIAIQRNSILDRAKRKAEKLVRLSVVMAIAVTIIALSILLTLKRAEDISSFEYNSRQIQSQFEFSPLEMLRNAIEEAQKFHSFEKNDRLGRISRLSTQAPKVTLQRLAGDIQELSELNTEQRNINSVNISNDNNQITTVGSNGTLQIWENQGHWQLIQSEKIGLAAINSFRYNKARDRAITGDGNGNLILWAVDPKTKRISPKSLKVHPAHEGSSIYNVRFGPDETTILTSGEIDGKLKFWKLEDNQFQLIWERQAHKGGINTVKLSTSSSEALIATGGQDGTAKIWNLDGNLEMTLTADESRGDRSVNSIEFYNSLQDCSQPTIVSTPSCEYFLVTGGNDGVVRIWNRSGNVVNVISGYGGQIRSIAVSYNKKMIAATSAKEVTVSTGSLVKLWDVETLELISEFRGHHGKIESIRFNQEDDRLITSGQDDSVVRIWALPTSKKIDEIRQLSRHSDILNSVRFSPDNQHLLSAGDDGELRWWRWSERNLYPNPVVWKPSGDRVKLITNRIHPDFAKTSDPVNLLAVGASNGKIYLLKTQENPDQVVQIGEIETLQGLIESMDFNPNPKQADQIEIATTGNDNTVKIWHIDRSSLTQSKLKISLQKTYERQVDSWSIRYSRDGHYLAIGGSRGEVLLIDLQRNFEKVLKAGNPETARRSIVGFSRDSRWLGATTESGEISTWSLANWTPGSDIKPSHQISTYQVGTNNLVFTKNPDQIATVGAGNAARIWDVKTGKLLSDLRQQHVEFRGQWGRLRSVHLSEDGKWLATGSDDGLPRIQPIEQPIGELIQKGCDWLQKADLSPDQLPTVCLKKSNQNS